MNPTERPPAIRLADGREVGTDTLEIARAHYPDAEWIGYQDGERFEEARPLTEVETDPSKLNREDLNAYAAERGVADPEKFKTKADLLAALEAPPEQSPEQTPDEPPTEAPVTDGENAPNEPPADTEGEGA